MENRKSADIDLILAVDEKIKGIRTKSLDISFNELSDMYDNDELVVNPDYQRLFRWSEEKQSRFIESLILELPLPPIFVLEYENGIYELIDGLQRISSYLHFRGILKDSDGLLYDPLKLKGCDIVNELDGLLYDELPPALKIRLRRNFTRVEVIRPESDPRLRYYMFKRLNTGGERLSEQEIRNCTIRLLDNKFNDFIIRMSNNENFKICMSKLPKKQKDKKFDQGYVLRFFALKNYGDKYTHDVEPFLNKYMEAVSDPKRTDVTFNYDKEITIFEKTFSILRHTLGEYSFSRLNNKGDLVSFSVYHYEAFTQGIQKYLDMIDINDEDVLEKIKGEFYSIKQDKDFLDIIGGSGGKNTSAHLNARISFVEKRLGGLLGGSI